MSHDCQTPLSSAYRIINTVSGVAILLPCGLISYNQNDVEQRYAACCGRYLDDAVEDDEDA